MVHTYITKHIHVVNVAFTILNEGSPTGNHSIAVVQVPEDYNSLSSSLIKEASELRCINVGGSEHEIEYFLGGDMTIVCGVEAANARFSCIWCKCPSKDRWEMTKDWSAFDTSKGARTVDEIENSMTLPKTRRMAVRQNHFSTSYQLTM